MFFVDVENQIQTRCISFWFTNSKSWVEICTHFDGSRTLNGLVHWHTHDHYSIFIFASRSTFLWWTGHHQYLKSFEQKGWTESFKNLICEKMPEFVEKTKKTTIPHMKKSKSHLIVLERVPLVTRRVAEGIHFTLVCLAYPVFYQSNPTIQKICKCAEIKTIPNLFIFNDAAHGFLRLWAKLVCLFTSQQMIRIDHS